MDMTAKSKHLSYWLRHKPEEIGLRLDHGGWAEVDDLLHKAAEHGFSYTLEDIIALSRPTDKLRFALTDDHSRIRAVHGHSVPYVDLGYTPVKPPDVLYHGTATRYLDSILKKGIHSAERQYVHVSPDQKKALSVGSRHGKPVLLKIDARAMHEQGFPFYFSENGIWLTPEVPVGFFSVQQSNVSE